MINGASQQDDSTGISPQVSPLVRRGDAGWSWFGGDVSPALRVERPGVRYHVTARGNERESIFHDGSDPLRFHPRIAQPGAPKADSHPTPQFLAKILVHTVFSTKDRRPLLRDKPLRDELHHYLGGVLTYHDCQALIIGGVETFDERYVRN
jgi:hypothetical protein